MEKLISIQQLHYSIPYAQKILEGITFEIHEGEFIGILGHNGSGKTTLLDLILGLRKSSSGSIKVLNEDPHKINRENKEKVIFLSQDVSLKGSLSISEFLNFHSSFYSRYSHEEESYLLDRFDLKRESKLGSLSTGQQKKVQIVAGLSSKPKLILVDEITAVLDPETREIFFTEIKHIQERDKTAIILTTNIAEDLIGLVDKVLFIKNTKGTFHSSEEILSLFNVGSAA